MNSEKVKRLKTKKLTSSTPAHKVAKSIRGRNLNGKLQQAIFEAPEALSDSFEILPPAELKFIQKETKPSYLESICEAIQNIGVPKKGASYLSIRNWIIGNREQTIVPNRLTAYLKRAIERGLESGVLSRSARCNNFLGLRGHFVLAKTKSAKKEKPKVAPTNKGSKTSVQKTQKAKEVLKSSVQKTQKAKEGLKSSVQKTQKAKEGLKSSVQKTQKAKEGLKSSVQKTQKAKEGLKSSVQKTQKAKEGLKSSVQKTQKAKEGLKSSVQKTQKAKEGLKSFVQKTQKVKEGPKSSVQKTQMAKEGSKSSVQKTQKAKEGSESSVQKTQMAKEGSESSVQKTQMAKGGSVSNTEIIIPVDKQVPMRLNLSDTSIMEANSTKLKSAVGTKVPRSKVIAKLAPKKTSLGKVVPVSKAIERLNGVKKPKQVISKAPKAKDIEETVNPEVQAKETKTKKLYTSNVKPAPKNFSRKDLSDTELEVKPTGRKSMKSYSSDTDISVIGLKEPKRRLKATNSKAV